MRSFLLAAAVVAAPAVSAPAALAAQAPAAPAANTAAAGSAPAAAAKLPDFSGTWELDAAKSNFGPQPGPTRMTMRVRHAGTALQLAQEASTPMGDQRDSVSYVIGGPAVAHEIPNVGPSSTTVTADGAALVTRAVIKTQGIEVPVDSRWALAPDGKTLTVDRSIVTPMGAMEMKLVFNKK